MRILLIHGFYQTRGGEDAVVENEHAMLTRRGHSVTPFFVHNTDIDTYSYYEKLMLLPRIIYNRKTADKLAALLSRQHFDIVHIHNIWPLLSPSLFFLLNRKNIPYLQTIHNYRYIVPNAMLFKEDVDPTTHRLTIAPRPLNSFRNSCLLTAAYALTAELVRRTRVIDDGCGALQVLNRFGYDIHRQRFNADKLVIRGNFLPDSVVTKMSPSPNRETYLYLGRLSEEKGVGTLIDAFSRLDTACGLDVAGTGPSAAALRQRSAHDRRIRFLGVVDGDRKHALLARAKALIVPSEWQEVFPVTIMEGSFSATPVIAARIGGLPDMVLEGRTGRLFESGDVEDLYNALRWCETHPEQLRRMGAFARTYAASHFGESESYAQLIDIYDTLIEKAKQRRRHDPRRSARGVHPADGG